MRFAFVVLCLVAAAPGCKKKLTWSDKKATEVVVGPYKIAIPAGWRTLAELEEESIKSKLPPGVVGIMPEEVESGGFQANIVFNWAPLGKDTPIPPCDQLAAELTKVMQGSATSVKSIDIEADHGCSWHIAKGDVVGIDVVRFQGDHELVVQCLAKAGDTKAHAVCGTVLASLHIPL